MLDFTESLVEKEPSSVTSYLAQLNQVLKRQVGTVIGEVTSVKPYPTAIYFSIKDPKGNALLNCKVWASEYKANGVEFKVGDEIILTGAPDIYGPSGSFNFIARTISYAGEGALKKAYDQLKLKLESEGLLSDERKRSLPEFPKKIGLITSMNGVVYQDFTANLSRHGFKIECIDTRVEGKDAIHQILDAIKTFSKRDIDVLVIMRGGGSLESLESFNTESVVRAISTFKVPVLTGIGHDKDITLSQLVADIGRSTPTAVAEAFNEQWDGLTNKLIHLQSSVFGGYKTAIDRKSRLIENSANKLVNRYKSSVKTSNANLTRSAQKITSRFTVLTKKVTGINSALRGSLGILKTNINLNKKVIGESSSKVIKRMNHNISIVNQSLQIGGKKICQKQHALIDQTQNLLINLEKSIQSHDPERNLKLGYSLSFSNGKVLRKVSDIKPGDDIVTQLSDGTFTSTAKRVK